MKTILTGVCAFGLVLAGSGIAVAQDTSTDTKSTMAGKTMKTSSEVITGKVESYDPGKSIKVMTAGKNSMSKSFDLDTKNETVHMASNVKVGDRVTVRERTAANGHKTLTVSRSKRMTTTKTTKKTAS
jgi:hypothetical protein